MGQTSDNPANMPILGKVFSTTACEIDALLLPQLVYLVFYVTQQVVGFDTHLAFFSLLG